MPAVTDPAKAVPSTLAADQGSTTTIGPCPNPPTSIPAPTIKPGDYVEPPPTVPRADPGADDAVVPERKKRAALEIIRAAKPLSAASWAQGEPAEVSSWGPRQGRTIGVVAIFVFDQPTAVPTDYGQLPAGNEDSKEPIDPSGGEHKLVPVPEGDGSYENARSVAVFVDLKHESVYMLRPFSFDFTNYGTGCSE